MAEDHNPQITLRLSAEQIESLIGVLGFALAAEDPPESRKELGELYDLLEAINDEHVVFPDEEIEREDDQLDEKGNGADS